MKKVLSILLAISMLLSICSVNVFAADEKLTFYADLSTTSADHGGEVVATIKWKNNPSDWGKGWAQGTIWVHFDNTVLEVDKSSVEGSTIVMGKPDEDDEDIINSVSGVDKMEKSSKKVANENGDFGFTMAFSYLLVQAKEGTVGTVTFKVKDDAAYADTTVTVEPEGLYSSTGPEGRYDVASMDEETYTGNAATLTVEVPKCAHENKTPTAAKAATCDEAGNIAYWTCGDCGKKFSDEACTTEVSDVTVAKLTHNMTHHAAVSETCTADGNKEYWACSLCQKNFADEAGTEVLADVTIAKHAHSMTHYTAVSATCTEDGNVEYWYCSECDKNYANELGTEVLSSTVAGKHAHTMTYTAAKAATCDAAGNKEYWSCSECGKKYDAENGGNVLTDVVLPKLSHAMTHHAAVSATCTEDGTVEYWACELCQKNFADEAGTEVLASIVEAKLGHTMNHVAAKASTCKEEGNVEYWACSLCQKNFADEAGTKELSEVKLLVVGHNIATWTETKAATTETEGEKSGACTMCSETFTVKTGKLTKAPVKEENIKVSGTTKAPTVEPKGETTLPDNIELVGDVFTVDELPEAKKEEVDTAVEKAKANLNLASKGEKVEDVEVVAVLDLGLFLNLKNQDGGDAGAVEYKLDGSLEITIEAPAAVLAAKNPKLLHILDDGSVELVDVVLNKDGTMTFVATGFSSYVVVDVETVADKGPDSPGTGVAYPVVALFLVVSSLAATVLLKKKSTVR